MSETGLLSIENVQKRFGGGRTLFGTERPAVHAVQDVTIHVKRGETLGIVGESGCGKSTLARMLTGLDRPTGGSILFDGKDLVAEASRDRRALSRRIQYVFQDPVASLNPRKTIRDILETPLIHLLGLDRAAQKDRLEELMRAVNLAPEFLERYPHEFSGGQAQRIGIARALAADPELIVLDEPVSALDVSVQAQVLNILDDLKHRFSLTYVFISHDLSVVESVSDRVAVMYFGRIAEVGPAREVFGRPRHPYTHLLLGSVPSPGKRSLAAEDATSELPDPYHPPPGCAFHARCPRGQPDCTAKPPLPTPAPHGLDHLAACYHPHGESERT
ncbi:Oligopeptide transport ATP-binding protein OppF [Hartmannibacter diazotrophicus]|uniref:Oligopeptide transport ATP-binding protein OppF n=1 Tax=Hartmannibacter diazotrophicus TaxID=1482074 RepID=A0A2C9DD45_9HYPH|nr:oligopeptide/dipeptide ABC transporter ATP-binding protein [Hartmannibacter diazotrophicus]SON58100.1 Oligopeptide transport ATP-binding protein OppF [Hartmannibacter diazotrophicus]